MSEASLKKAPAWGLSTTLDAGRLEAGRLNAGRYGCGSSITLIIYAIVKTPGGSGVRVGSERGERPMAPLPKKGTFPLS